jgi:hypothetical protein
MSSAETAAMPRSSLSAGSPAGDGTTDHEVPFQCSMRLWVLVDVVMLPTAQMSVLDSASAACSLVSSDDGRED